MRLLEYKAAKFFEDCSFNQNEKHVVEKIGFLFGLHEFHKLDSWIDGSGFYTEINFINEVYSYNIENNIMSETELLSNLARFLCGYQVQVSCREEYLQLPENKKSSFFQNIKDDIDIYIKEVDIKNKIAFVKTVLKL